MYLTKEVLEQYGACNNGIEWFTNHYPEGAELSTVIENTNTPLDFLEWGYESLPTDQLERAAAIKAMDVIDSTSVFDSSDVKNSNAILHSTHVIDSHHVNASTRIVSSSIIFNSHIVNNGQQIFESKLIYDSQHVVTSKNVTNSYNIYNSGFIIDSSNVFESTNIEGSNTIRRCNNISKSFFCTDSENLRDCMFCTHTNGAAVAIFNKPVTERQYAIARAQLTAFMPDYLPFFDFDAMNNFYERPRASYRIPQHFDNLPSEFWMWVETLPNYHPDLLYCITLRY